MAKVVSNSLYVWQEGQDNTNLDLMKKYEGTVTVTNCYQTANVGNLGKTVLAEVPANSIARQYTIYNTHCYESCTVSGVNESYMSANGATISVLPTVQLNGTNVAAENYTVAYKRNGVAVTQVAGSGDYTITVTGKEDKGYSGTWSKDFTVKGNEIYTITYDANGGTGAPAAQTKTDGVDLTLTTSVPTRPGYKFVGWKASNEAGHDYVDLGLPSGLKWATCNIGATKPEEYGNYYAWGETKAYGEEDESNTTNYSYTSSEGSATYVKTTFNDYTYKYGDDLAMLTKYCDDSRWGNNGFTDTLTTLDLADDAACANWGGSWRMPTHAEQKELVNNCTSTWTTVNGVYGRLFTSKSNGKTLFLPAAGWFEETWLHYAGSEGDYWSSSLDSDCPILACPLNFSSSDVCADYSNLRCYGQPVRAVTAISTYAAGATYSANADVTLYAQWEKLYTITYDANGGTGVPASQTKIEGEDLTLSTTIPTREGYKFVGWCTTVDDSQYVDLGLPSGLKWATCNIGATKPEEYGDYFAWGETTGYNNGKSDFSWSTYKWCNGDDDKLTKYCNNSRYGYNGFTDTKTELDLADDAARANWGGSWHIPTHAEQEELVNNCTTTWTTVNGVYGRLFTSKNNGKTLFLPAAGIRFGTTLEDAGYFGYYWSSSINSNRPDNVWTLEFYSEEVDAYSLYDRGFGQPVRAVISNYSAGATYSANADVTL